METKRTLVHAGVEELDLLLLRAVSVLGEAVALIDALRRVDGVDLCMMVRSRYPIRTPDSVLTQAQLTRPQRPPATTTAIGEVGEFPRALASTCLELSYVMK